LIIPSRGIRQGDPLSPYLFLLCAEGLSSLLRTAEQEGKITWVPFAHRGFKLSHLFFADDNLLFCRANFVEWGNLLQLLRQYEQASGQNLNNNKTIIFYSHNTGMEFRELICSNIGITAFKNYEKHLGLPALVGRAKVSTFKGILNRVQRRLDGWKEKFLSQARREILLKAVVQAILTYNMSVFQLPKILCRSLNSMMGHFWWGNQSNKRKASWMSWNRLGLPKSKGGMGFRNIEVFNTALFA
jgi:hypothetical protein